MENYELAVVIPVYNEEEIIAAVVNSWKEELNKLGVHFIIHVYNDGSKDDTLLSLEKFKDDPFIRIHDKKNSGHGSTILLGYKENCIVADWVFQVDSDNEISAGDFYKLWQKRGDFDVLIGIKEGSPTDLGQKNNQRDFQNYCKGVLWRWRVRYQFSLSLNALAII